jgi:hypothetical protein
MRHFKSLSLILGALLMLILAPSLAYAEDSQLFAACKNAPNSAICAGQNTTTNPVNHILHVAADIVALLTGLAAVILIIISGISMITSGGNTEAAANARKRITNAIIGLVVVAFAWTIVTFLTDKLIT